jgi:hypothetical protein
VNSFLRLNTLLYLQGLNTSSFSDKSWTVTCDLHTYIGSHFVFSFDQTAFSSRSPALTMAIFEVRRWKEFPKSWIVVDQMSPWLIPHDWAFVLQRAITSIYICANGMSWRSTVQIPPGYMKWLYICTYPLYVLIRVNVNLFSRDWFTENKLSHNEWQKSMRR